MAELTDSMLQGKVLRLAVAVAGADRHYAGGEALVLEAAYRHWGQPAFAGLGDPPPAGLHSA